MLARQPSGAWSTPASNRQATVQALPGDGSEEASRQGPESGVEQATAQADAGPDPATRRFASVECTGAVERSNEHGGSGPILFRRILDRSQFESPIDFIDYTRIPPGSVIGRHQHSGNEEIYFVTAGTPLVRVNGEEARLANGSFSIVRDGEWHELINDTGDDVEILVIQVGVPQNA